MPKKERGIEEQLQRAIEESGMSRYALSKLSGVDQGILSRFLSEGRSKQKTITLSTAARLCRVLGLELKQTKKKRG